MLRGAPAVESGQVDGVMHGGVADRLAGQLQQMSAVEDEAVPYHGSHEGPEPVERATHLSVADAGRPMTGGNTWNAVPARSNRAARPPGGERLKVVAWQAMALGFRFTELTAGRPNPAPRQVGQAVPRGKAAAHGGDVERRIEVALV